MVFTVFFLLMGLQVTWKVSNSIPYPVSMESIYTQYPGRVSISKYVWVKLFLELHLTKIWRLRITPMKEIGEKMPRSHDDESW